MVDYALFIFASLLIAAAGIGIVLLIVAIVFKAIYADASIDIEDEMDNF